MKCNNLRLNVPKPSKRSALAMGAKARRFHVFGNRRLETDWENEDWGTDEPMTFRNNTIVTGEC